MSCHSHGSGKILKMCAVSGYHPPPPFGCWPEARSPTAPVVRLLVWALFPRQQCRPGNNLVIRRRRIPAITQTPFGCPVPPGLRLLCDSLFGRCLRGSNVGQVQPGNLPPANPCDHPNSVRVPGCTGPTTVVRLLVRALFPRQQCRPGANW